LQFGVTAYESKNGSQDFIFSKLLEILLHGTGRYNLPDSMAFQGSDAMIPMHGALNGPSTSELDKSTF
jgi:hypothetical protein